MRLGQAIEAPGKSRAIALLPWTAVAVCCLLTLAGLLLRPHAMAWPTNLDWSEVYLHHASVRDSLLNQGELPWYSPYVNGGYPLASYPQSPALSPFLPFTLIFGEVYGPRVTTAVIYLLGVWGMALFCRRVIPLPPWPAAFSAALFASSGWLAARLAGGNFSQVFYYLFPMAAFLLFAAEKRPILLFPLGAILYVFLEEAKYAYPICILFLFACAFLVGTASLGQRKKIAALLLCAVLFSALAGTLKIALMLDLLSRTSPEVSYADASRVVQNSVAAMPFPSLVTMLTENRFGVSFLSLPDLSRISERPLSLGNGYLGCGLAAAAAALAAFFLGLKKARGLAVIFAAAFAISYSAYLPLDLFRPLSRLPVFRGLNDPEKYFNFFLLFSICAAGGTLASFLGGTARSKTARTALVLFFSFAVAVPLIGNGRLLMHLFPGEQPGKNRPGGEFHQVFMGHPYFEYRAGHGALYWYTRLRLPIEAEHRYKSSLELSPNPAYRGEAYSLPEGPPLSARISYNHAEICGDQILSVRAVANLNWLPGFSARNGRAEPYQGLVSVIPDPGARCVSLAYRPPHLTLYAGISIFSVLAFLAGCLLLEKRRKADHDLTERDGD
ncbi:MAG: hypothetical protein AB1921_07455 [Thermodesulfobacteriota bacterium]